VRRTRISERIRKLQELVPNMEKVRIITQVDLSLDCFVFGMLTFLSYWQQTSTAEMLDLAVDYIKNLQNQFKVLKGRSWLESHSHGHALIDSLTF